jgi:hypothetical protein
MVNKTSHIRFANLHTPPVVCRRGIVHEGVLGPPLATYCFRGGRKSSPRPWSGSNPGQSSLPLTLLGASLCGHS